MSLTCAISGVTPEEPVISKQGYIFEKRLIVKHLKASGTCPVTKAELTVEELIPIQTSPGIRPRPPTATSIPGLLQLFQNEWDAVMLETHTLKSHLETCRQELAHALYKHDAACRVIARLLKERDQARAALAATSTNVAAAVRGAAPAGGADEPTRVLPGEVVAKLEATSGRLSSTRKARTKASAARVTPAERLSQYAAKASHALPAPSVSLDVNAANVNQIVTGGVDGSAVVFDHTTSKIVDTLKGHTKALTQTRYHPTNSAIFTSSQDGTANVWTRRGGEGKYSVASTLREHKASITDVSVSPDGDYLLASSADRSWSLFDVAAGVSRYVTESKEEGIYNRVSFHPDGLIFGAGTNDHLVRIWDLKQLKNVAVFKGHEGAVTNVSFSENGYYLSSSDERGVVKLWDLRKLANFQTISTPEVSVVKSLDFDASGSYLAVGGSDVRIYGTKTWDTVARFTDHRDEVGGVRFGPDASWLASTGKDRTLKIFSS